ncbi:tRNA-Thr(GGU) m(6)t(6)A37 methyltransferase TsaA [Acinetobacter calcoaceticus]|uniref:tRNA-Thr(GGU) m(6)t(6)A37 methyltransferase TsaA n=1 Tax=Acinetobacter calcoaceticus TaxID=471 RepID=A0A4R1Y5E1_ACICA|nr:tRNA-Thr(GGU) m(6)t(6)A37 methyltransferase TsaA [Acinetobacter calcoaceticus]
MKEICIPIIGYMRSAYKEKFGIPRQPNLVDLESYIEMQVPYNDILAFEGIDAFSHLWLIWQFHQNKNSAETQTVAVHSDQDLDAQQTVGAAKAFRAQVRPPRLGGNQKIGVFATRSMYRPAPLGLSVVQFKRVEKQGKSLRLYVTGSDLLDGTPIIDIKPYIQYSDAVPTAQSGYAQQQPARKLVHWRAVAQDQQLALMNSGQVTAQMIDDLVQVLSLDPRPAYQQDQHRVYGMRFAALNVKFCIDDQGVQIEELALYQAPTQH